MWVELMGGDPQAFKEAAYPEATGKNGDLRVLRQASGVPYYSTIGVLGRPYRCCGSFLKFGVLRQRHSANASRSYHNMMASMA